MSKVSYLSEIVVHRDYVGQGIGRKLINILKNNLKADNITKLYAERHMDNKPSYKVMENTGFTIIDEYDDEERRPTGSNKTIVAMVKL